MTLHDKGGRGSNEQDVLFMTRHPKMCMTSFKYSPYFPKYPQQDVAANLDLDPSTMSRKDPNICFFPLLVVILTISEPKSQRETVPSRTLDMGE